MVRTAARASTRASASAALLYVLAVTLFVLQTASVASGNEASPKDKAEPTVTSYAQVRITDPTGDHPFLGIRRLKVMVEGPWGNSGGYYVQGLIKTGNRSGTDDEPYIQELRAWRDLGRLRITLGQMKPPFGWERFTADSELAVIERAPVTDLLVPNGSLGEAFARDRGVQCDWTHQGVKYSLGLFDGAGANNTPHGIGPLVTGRVVWDRPVKLAGHKVQAHVEAAGSWRRARNLDFSSQLPGSASLGYTHFRGRDWRADIAAGLKGPRWETRAEYISATFRPSDTGAPRIRADGFYLQASYRFAEQLEGAVKYDLLNPRRGVRGGNDRRQVTFGVNYYIRGNREKLQLNYVLRRAAVGSDPADVWVCQYQRFF